MSRRSWGRGLWLLVGVLYLTGTLARADEPGPLVLRGEALSTADILSVVREHRAVAIDPKARARVAATFDVVLAAARAHLPVYGLTTGVGWNKDKDAMREGEAMEEVGAGVPHAGGAAPGAGSTEPAAAPSRPVVSAQAAEALDPALLAASERFNLGTLRAHAAGVGEALPDDVVRAAMVIRLNLLLTGDGGVQPAVVDQYAAFIRACADDVVEQALSYVFSKDRDFQEFLKTPEARQVASTLRIRKAPAPEAIESAGKNRVSPVQSLPVPVTVAAGSKA